MSETIVKPHSRHWGLVLSGGAACGLADVGVLEVLHEAGLRPACIAGSSMGAIVAAPYAMQHPPSVMRELLGSLAPAKVVRLSKRPLRGGLHGGFRGFQIESGSCLLRMQTLKCAEFLLGLAERHDAQPVHTATEMRLLQERFPDNIRLFVLSHGDEWRAGEVIFLSNNVLRFQYGFYFFTDRREALSLRTLEWLRTNEALHLPWMDLGTSMDPDTGELVGTLHLHKEIFGARGVPLKTWEWVP